MTGMFPAEVLSTTTDLVSRWVAAGGTLVWGGTPIGAWSAPPRSNTRRRPGDISIGPPGVERLLGPGFVGAPPNLRRYASRRTATARRWISATNTRGSPCSTPATPPTPENDRLGGVGSIVDLAGPTWARQLRDVRGPDLLRGGRGA